MVHSFVVYRSTS